MNTAQQGVTPSQYLQMVANVVYANGELPAHLRDKATAAMSRALDAAVAGGFKQPGALLMALRSGSGDAECTKLANDAAEAAGNEFWQRELETILG